MLCQGSALCLSLSLGFVIGCPGAMPTDLCADVTCDAGETCVEGTCVQDTPTADPVAGEAFFMDKGCAGCHGADAMGVEGSGPNITDTDAATIFDKLSGAVFHAGGTREGVTEQDATDIEAWKASLTP